MPVPMKWNELWELLPDRKRVGHSYELAPPLILNGWVFSDDDDKRSRLLVHIEWANEKGVLKDAADFLYGLQEDDWHYKDR